MSEDMEQIGTINLCPNWEASLGMLETALTCGNAEGRQIAREELRKMARLADLYVESQKKGDQS